MAHHGGGGWAVCCVSKNVLFLPRNSTEQLFFVPARTQIGVKLLTSFGKNASCAFLLVLPLRVVENLTISSLQSFPSLTRFHSSLDSRYSDS